MVKTTTDFCCYLLHKLTKLNTILIAEVGYVLKDLNAQVV